MKAFLRKVLQIIPDRPYVVLQYFSNFHRLPDLKNPETFNEKLLWLKLYDHRPEYSIIVDKYLVKDYVSRQIDRIHVIPTLGVWDRPEDIDFDRLPDKFVLKWNHDSGSVVICKDKQNFDKSLAIKKLQFGVAVNGYWYGREWPYKHVPPKIIAESYLDGGEVGLDDYKVFCFNGVPRVILVCRNRFSASGMTEDFFDCEWNHLDVRRPNHPNSTQVCERPGTLKEMLELSKRLSKGFPFIRTDFYTVSGQVYFGELTLYPASGALRFVPDSFDREMGMWLTLPDHTNNIRTK